jgi:Restriction Enzyme Adenine Methylase Associated
MPAPITPASAQVPSDPDAPVILDFGVHALRVALVSRRHVLKLSSIWAAPGVYVLLGPLGTDDKTELYVGKAVKVRDRLNHHRNSPKLPWWRAIAVTRDTTAGFNSAEIGYLEGRLYSELSPLPSVSLKADKHDLDTTLPQYMLVQLDAFVPTILAALRLAGVDLGDGSTIDAGPSGKTRQVIQGSIGELLAAGLVSAGTVLTFERSGKSAEATITADGQLVVDGKAFGSPSTAAAVALGLKAANGWKSWRLNGGSGPTLAELRAQLPSPTESL